MSATVWVNGTRDSVADGTTVAQVLADRGLRPDEVSVLLNGEAVPRDACAARLVHDGDRLEFVHFHGGG